MFTPALRRNTGFWIGAKGAEKVVKSFEEALNSLRSMPVPRWRRPNTSGNWGIVAGIEWVELKVEPESE